MGERERGSCVVDVFYTYRNNTVARAPLINSGARAAAAAAHHVLWGLLTCGRNERRGVCARARAREREKHKCQQLK